VYWPAAEDEAWSEQLTITPGQSQLQENTPLFQPYGSISSDNLYTNPYFPDAADLLTQPSEHDYACVILDQAFSGINTFMPLEFNALPARVKTAGYPPLVQGETNSQDMWFTSGAVLGTRGENEQIIDFDVYISGGHSGSPIWYYDEISQENRVIGIVTWKNGTSASGVRLTDMNKRFISEWLTMGSSDYKHTYYIPYFAVTESIWSGLALANHNNRENDIQIEYFAPDGSPAGSKIFTLEKYGQTAFPCAPNFAFGWVRISSSMPLYGLQLIGNLNPSTLFDIDMQASLNKKLILPHLAADGENWRSIAVFCNPNSVEAKITYTYYDPETGAATNATTTIPAWGRDIHELKERFGKDLNGGHILVQSTQPIAGFLLYDSSFTGENNWRAGLNAIPFTGK
ncbi:MAG: hypothetical protein KAG92_10745, partial [Deltaproteobacteria bacterium]|nr:hypothetical protein [Deltaproteobacteria bacterium]